MINNNMSADNLSFDGCNGLAEAIICQAIEDYKRVTRIAEDKKNPEADKAERERRRIERFFASEYFNILNQTNFSGKQIIGMLRSACAS